MLRCWKTDAVAIRGRLVGRRSAWAFLVDTGSGREGDKMIGDGFALYFVIHCNPGFNKK
jgi:hypothetical protein